LIKYLFLRLKEEKKDINTFFLCDLFLELDYYDDGKKYFEGEYKEG